MCSWLNEGPNRKEAFFSWKERLQSAFFLCRKAPSKPAFFGENFIGSILFSIRTLLTLMSYFAPSGASDTDDDDDRP